MGTIATRTDEPGVVPSSIENQFEFLMNHWVNSTAAPEDGGFDIVIGQNGSDEARQIQRDGEHKTEVVIGVLADQVHPARRTEHANALAGSIELAECLDDHDRE